MGYAFINFIHSAFILDFYQEYNNKRWRKYNSEKVCMITYGRIQGKRELLKHFENSKVQKNKNKGVKPKVIKGIKKADEKEVRNILDKYYKKRLKEKIENSKQELKKKESAKEGNIKDISSVPKEKEIERKNYLKKLLGKAQPFKNKSLQPKKNPISSKRNSQKPSESKPKLDEKAHGKRPLSDDELKKKNAQKQDQSNPIIKALKVNLKGLPKKA